MNLNRLISPNMEGDDVKYLQTALKSMGYYNGDINGVYTQKLLISIRSFQSYIGLEPDGIIGPLVWSRLTLVKNEVQPQNKVFISSKLSIYDKQVDDTMYIKEETSKNTIVIYNLDTLNMDSVMGMIGPNKYQLYNYIIDPDGLVYKLFDDKFYSEHLDLELDKERLNFMNSKSISIGLLNYGSLSKIGDLYYSKEGNCVNDYYLNEYKNNYYWHKYKNEQLSSLKELIILLSSKWDINLKLTTWDKDAFYKNDKWSSLVGIRLASQISTNRIVHPQPELIEILNII